MLVEYVKVNYESEIITEERRDRNRRMGTDYEWCSSAPSETAKSDITLVRESIYVSVELVCMIRPTVKSAAD